MRMFLVLLLVLLIQPFAFSQQFDSLTNRDLTCKIPEINFHLTRADIFPDSGSEQFFDGIPDTIPVSKRDTIPSRSRDTVKLGDRRDTSNAVIITGDTVINAVKKDTVRKHSPRKAAIRSALVPGLGQIYNRKYWKLPLVYAAVGIPAYLIYYNKQWYDRARYALSVASNPPIDTPTLMTVHPELRAITAARSVNSLRNYRDEFRKNMDYSILITILAWGLNVIDATVDAHLKDFDVSDEISMRVKPVIMTGTRTPGLSLVFSLRDKHQHQGKTKALY
ncbi:MAG: hypothetical protein EOO04_22570 [Chitinophagaceae bacterium]|nr:MAG: hypothetical protein EOO04_22570 [Chitinophagaceae bacterium]